MLEDSARRTTRNVLTTVGIIMAIVLVYALAIQQTEIELVKPLDPVRQESVLRVLRLLANPDIFEVQEATGNLALSEAAQITIERIIETILMALIASTVGTVLAVPASFLAARNLMEDITSPLAAIMAGIVAIPIGGYIGWLFSSTLNGWVETVANLSAGTYISLGVVVGTVPAVWAVNRFSPPLVSVEKRSRGVELRALLAVLASLILALIGLLMLAQLGLTAGAYLRRALSFTTFLGIDLFGFVGDFVFVMSDFVILLLPATIALVAAVLTASYGTRLGQQAVIAWPAAPARALATVLTILGTAIFAVALAGFVNWLKLFDIAREWALWMAVAGGLTVSLLAVAAWPFERRESRYVRILMSLLIVLVSSVVAGLLIYAVGRAANPLFDQDDVRPYVALMALVSSLPAALLAFVIPADHPFDIGFGIYTVSRSILNILRSIEPLIMGIVFVVWVSLGPFAGIMALTLHSIAALGKLFSEQVEGILEGPVEAITATGAGRLQTIAYAVIPQIIPPYIAFALYRWDINVRMSTIIGFVGGGGIGFVLSQNIQQLRYRQASVMMLAIAIVVALLDYASSRIRSRII